MIYKILNKLFGWDFIYWANCASQGVSIIRTDYYGNPYYVWAVGVKVRITSRDQVMWLTCPSDKYLKERVR